MSATAEKSKPAARRSRLELVDAGIAKDEQALEAARARFVELAAAEDQAVAETKRSDPSANAYALRSPAWLIRDEREKLERTIVGLEKGLLVLRGQRDAAAAEAAARKLAERTKSAKALTERERALRREAGEAFGALVSKWNALAENLDEQSALAAGADSLVRSVGLFDRAAVAAWEQASGFVVTPVPVDFASWLEEALAATTGDRPDDDDAGSLADLNRQRAAQGLPAEQRTVPPAARELAQAYPDLRGEARTANVTGVAVRRREGRVVEGRFGGAAA